jgi:hypothetical protein
VKAWALAWFYGAVPVVVIGTFLGSHELHAPPPTPGLLIIIFAIAAAMGIGAIGSIRASRVV